MAWALPSWWRRPRSEETDDDPLVCFCRKVTRSALERAIRDGARTVADLTEATRAGSGCGTCRIDLIAMLEAAEEARHGR